MTKAQEVRMNRLNAINTLTRQAKEIFDWILDLIDADTQKETFEPINLYLNTSRVIVRFKNLDGGARECLEHYALKGNLPEYSSIQLFTALKEVVEQEEGFTAVIEKSNALGTIVHVVIE